MAMSIYLSTWWMTYLKIELACSQVYQAPVVSRVKFWGPGTPAWSEGCKCDLGIAAARIKNDEEKTPKTFQNSPKTCGFSSTNLPKLATPTSLWNPSIFLCASSRLQTSSSIFLPTLLLLLSSQRTLRQPFARTCWRRRSGWFHASLAGNQLSAQSRYWSRKS